MNLDNLQSCMLCPARVAAVLPRMQDLRKAPKCDHVHSLNPLFMFMQGHMELGDMDDPMNAW